PAKDMVPALRDALKDDDEFVRLAAAKLLWKIDKNSDGVKVLAALLKTYFWDDAAGELGEMGPAAKAALPELRDALSREDKKGTNCESLREAIRRIDPKESDEPEKENPTGDSQRPTLNITLTHAPDGTARADWNIQGKAIKFDTLALQYRIPPGQQWYA